MPIDAIAIEEPIVTQKVKVKISGKTVPLDKYFLDLLAVSWYGEKYEDDEVRKRVNAVVRELVHDAPRVSPQIVNQRIALSFLPKNIQALMLAKEKK